MKKNKFLLVSVIFIVILLVQPQNFQFIKSTFTQNDLASQLNISDSPEEKNADLRNAHHTQNAELKSKVFDGQEQVIVVNNRAQFTTEELSLENGSWENYSDLDFLNRVGVAEAMLGQDLMPTSEREDISSVKPTGWKNKKIMFNGKEDYLYNRSQSSMLYYENLIADYIRQSGHHVRYRVTPLFRNVELVARGIRLEAQSVEDDTISFDVYIFNIQPGYEINYLTGTSEKLQ
ncbi:DNA/RNA non-specific endonuclease [Streptococcus suis]|uniref:DNA/RNA non-specific endonuclease n=1 Tax=Streptococcus suis TaxID=1307 RepID=UPI002FC81178